MPRHEILKSPHLLSESVVNIGTGVRVYEGMVLPRGWTALVHGTNTVKWVLGQQEVMIRGLGMSALSIEHIERNRMHGEQAGDPNKYNTTSGYAGKGLSNGNRKVEVVVGFYRGDLASTRLPNDDVKDIGEALEPDTRSLITKYFQPRHAVIPKNEVLVKIGTHQTEDKVTETFVPKSILPDYVRGLCSLAAELIDLAQN